MITAKAGGEPAGGNKTIDHIAILAEGRSALSMQVHGPLSAVGTHLWACKTHDMKEVEYSISDSIRICV